MNVLYLISLIFAIVWATRQYKMVKKSNSLTEIEIRGISILCSFFLAIFSILFLVKG